MRRPDITAKAVGFGLCVATILSFAILAPYVWVDYRSDLSRTSTELVIAVTDMRGDINDALSRLSENPGYLCTSDQLAAMARYQRQSPYIASMGQHHRGDLLCATTGAASGLQATLTSRPTYTTPDGLDVFIASPVSGATTQAPSLIYQLGPTVVRVDLSVLSEDAQGFTLSVTDNGHNLLGTGAGFEGLPLLGSRYLVQTTCGAGAMAGGCVTLGKTLQQVVMDHRPGWGPISALFAGLACVASLLLQRFFRYRSKIPMRLNRSWNVGFFCVYQPIVEMSSKHVTHLEVLARFQDKEGLIGPGDFIPAILKSARTEEFTHRIITQAMKDLALIVEDYPAIGVAFNIFPEDLTPHKADRLIAHILRHRPSGHTGDITIEILETGELEMSAMVEVMPKFRDAGFVVSLDDFGTGFSNMSILRQLSLNKLKIDQSFVRDMLDDTAKAQLVPHMVEIAASLGLKTVAEGIEEPLQEATLKDLGVHYGQGWLYGKPQDIQALKLTILRSHHLPTSEVA